MSSSYRFVQDHVVNHNQAQLSVANNNQRHPSAIQPTLPLLSGSNVYVASEEFPELQCTHKNYVQLAKSHVKGEYEARERP